jgi:hypothetical protein
MKADFEESGKVICKDVEVTITKGVPATPYGNIPPDECYFKVSAQVSVKIDANHKLIFKSGPSRVLHVTQIQSTNVAGGVALQVIQGVLDR